MNLSDLTIDCLEEVSEFLDIVDLLNAADTSPRLRQAASLVYVQKYGEMSLVIEDLAKRRTRLDCHDIISGVVDAYHFNIGFNLRIKCSTISVHLLRCFGHLIPSISCFYGSIQRSNGVGISFYRLY